MIYILVLYVYKQLNKRLFANARMPLSLVSLATIGVGAGSLSRGVRRRAVSAEMLDSMFKSGI